MLIIISKKIIKGGECSKRIKDIKQGGTGKILLSNKNNQVN